MRLPAAALLVACLAWGGAGAEPVQADRHADQHARKHAAGHAGAHTHAHTHAHAHKLAHAPVHKASRKPTHSPAHKPAHGPARKPARPGAQLPAVAASHAPAHAAARRSHAADPGGEGFLDLYAELCVKRIDEIDAFRAKLLRARAPRLQPDSAKWYLAGMEGDVWPVPYHGRTGNFVLVLAKNRDLCMLYARRTDTAAVEQGFSEMVAKPPAPMIARRGRQPDAARLDGPTRTVAMTWAPPRAQRKMRFVLATTSALDAKVQAYASVAIVSGLESGPGPDTAGGPVTRAASGSPAPAQRPRARP